MAAENSDNSFSSQVSEGLGYYVYRIIDPRNGTTFYVGKGQGNRVFAHAKSAKNEDDALVVTLKEELSKERLTELDKTQAKSVQLKQVRKEIKDKVERVANTLNSIFNDGLEPVYIIHRHGLDESTALEVEAALIDAYPGLTNEKGGYHSRQQGIASILQVKEQYDFPVMTDPKDNGHKVLALNVKHTKHLGLYTAVRSAWKIKEETVMQKDFLIFAMDSDICLGVYVPDEWKHATKANFSRLDKDKGEGYWGFNGKPADEDIQKLYTRKRLPDCLKPLPGTRSSFRYLGAWPHKAPADNSDAD